MRPTKPRDSEVAARYRAAGYWRDRTLDQYLSWCARELGDRVAVVDRGERVTFAALERQARRLAAVLTGLGVEPGDVVSFQLPNRLEAVVTFHATMVAGAVANPIVPIYRGHELRHILAQARTKVAVIPGTLRGFDFVDLYRRMRADLPDLGELIVVGDCEPQERERRWADVMDAAPASDDAYAAPELDPDDVALLLYTSGTTGVSKGALHSHNTLLFQAHLLTDWFSLDERDVFLCVSPVTHVTGLLHGVVLPFVTGARVVLQEIWNADAALAEIENEAVSYLMLSTPFLQALTSSPRLQATAVSSLRYVMCGGADMPVALMETAASRLCPGVVRVYGATEGPTPTCTNRWDPPAKRVATDGRWTPSYEGMVVDERENPVPPGTIGQVLWRGASTFLGYLDPDLNAAAFTPEGWFRTGDLGVVDEDGYLTIVGRLKDIIIRSGEKISAYEVEQLLFEHPAVREVAVVAKPDPVTGEKACAWVVLQDGQGLDLPEVEEFLVRREVAKQKIPEDLVLVDALPKTASGKVQKAVLRQWAAERIEHAERDL